MVRVPLPQEIRRIPGTGGFGAPAIVGPRRAAGRGIQINRLGRAMLSAGLTIFEEANKRDLRVAVIQAKKGQALLSETVFEKVRAFKNLVGTDAIENADATREAIEKAGEEIGAGLPPAARDVFNDNLSRMLLSARANIAAHEDREIRAASDGTSTALIARTRDLAIAQALDPAPPQEEQAQQDPQRIRVPGDPEELKPPDFAKTVRAEARNRAINRYGSGATEQINREVVEEMTALHAGVVAGMVDRGEGSRASDYLASDTVQREVDEVSMIGLRSTVRRASVGEEAADRVAILRNELQARHRKSVLQSRQDLPAGPPSPGFVAAEAIRLELPADTLLDEGMASIRAAHETGEITRPVRDAMFGELQQVHREFSSREATQKDRVSRRAEQIMLEKKSGVEGLPPSLFSEAAELGLVGDLSRFAANDHNYPTDKRLFSDLLLPGGGPDRWYSRPIKVFEPEMRRRLNQPDFDKAMALYQAVNNPSQRDFSFLTPLRSVTEQAERLGIDPQEDLEEFTQYRRAVEELVNARGIDPAKQPKELDQVYVDIEESRAALSTGPTFLGGLSRILAPHAPLIFPFQTAIEDKPFELMTPEERKDAFVFVNGRRVKIGGAGGLLGSEKKQALIDIRAENARRAALPVPSPPLKESIQEIAEFVVARRGRRQ